MKTSCDRCYKTTAVSIMSKYNRDEICLECKQDETTLPSYAAADAAEVASVRSGNYNFDGVGLTASDRELLAAKKADRFKSR